MRRLLFILFPLLCFMSTCEDPNQIRVLVFSKTEANRHESISKGKKTLWLLGWRNKWKVDTLEDASVFTPEKLARYRAVVFLNTTGDVLNEAQQEAFENYIRAGGGFMGIHSAADTEYDWPWYGKLVGAYFENHPEIQRAWIQLEDDTHLATSHLPDRWQREDEWYNYKNIQPNLKLLLSLDESSYAGGTNGEVHPLSWYQEYDGGRSFYTGGGHTIGSYDEPLFVLHLLGGLKYALGLEE